MSHRGRQSADELLVAALAAGKTVRDAAAMAGVSEKTAHRRNADPDFQNAIAAQRAKMIGSAAGRLADGMAGAADVLRELLAEPDPNVRYKAAGKLIELAMKVSEVADLERRLDDLERRFTEPKGASI